MAILGYAAAACGAYLYDPGLTTGFLLGIATWSGLLPCLLYVSFDVGTTDMAYMCVGPIHAQFDLPAFSYHVTMHIAFTRLCDIREYGSEAAHNLMWGACCILTWVLVHRCLYIMQGWLVLG